jgi:peptidyl-prolyl cis-trans isomerase A (cyclophilin A)
VKLTRIHAAVAVLLVVACEAPPQPTASSAETATVAPAPKPPPSPSVPEGPPLLTPGAAIAQAPDKFQVELDTTKGKVVIEVTREWAPRGADRFFNLVKIGFYTDVAFFRVVKDFVVQFGIHGDPKVMAAWREATIMDEMVKQPNVKGTVTFAKRTSDTRTTQIFINMKDNQADLDDRGFAPFGKVVEGMDVLQKLYSDYAERPQEADNPKRMLAEGNEFLKKQFPKLDYIKSARVK